MRNKISLIFIMVIVIGICISSVVISNHTFSYAQKSLKTAAEKMTPLPQTNNNSTNASLDSTQIKTNVNKTIVMPSIKITSPNNGQKVPGGGNGVVISGTSSDTISKDCAVSIIVNSLKPYQKAVATGHDGTNDYSSWEYKLTPTYTTLKEGSNKITAKMMCIGNPNNSTKWTSVNVTGVGASANSSTASNITSNGQQKPQSFAASLGTQPQEQKLQLQSPSLSHNQYKQSNSVKPATPAIRPTKALQNDNNNTIAPIHGPITPAGGANGSSVVTTTTVTSKQEQPLQVLVGVDKNPIMAGDIQTITIAVHSSDIANSAISGAKVSGQVIQLSSTPSYSYPSNNTDTVTEQFDGITDINGQVSYSLKTPDSVKVDTTYRLQVDASSNGYYAKPVSTTFTVKPSLTNNDNNFILAQANRKFTNGLNDDVKKFTEGILDKVRNSLENKLK